MSATYADKPWLKNDPPGVPAQIPVDVYPSLVALLEEAFRKHARRDAAACIDQRLTFAQVDEPSRSLGAWLQARGLA